MKFIICSDIHGDLTGAEAALSLLKSEGADKLIILGDVLYHGPRNNLPEGYNPKAVIALLNENRDKILAVRGNCDTEVDQMVLEFNISSEFAIVYADGKTLILNHGHKIDLDNPPPMCDGDILFCGHTHIPAKKSFGKNNVYYNPGSISIPKGGFPRSYVLYENGEITLKDLTGKIIEL